MADSESAYLYRTTSSTLAGRRIRLREARADFDGYIAELLSKALSQSRLFSPLPSPLLPRLRLAAPVCAAAIARFARREFRLLSGIDWDSQPTMLQVVGGMDRLPAALAARLGNRIVYRAAVREIRQSERGVWVVYADADGRLRRVDADYCVCTLPLPVLSELQKDLSQPVQSAIASASYDGAGKIGLQFRRRFWEDDDESTAAGPGRTRRLDKSSIQHTASTGVKGSSWATTWISKEPCASAPLPNVSGLRSSRAPAFTRSPLASSRRRSPSRGLVCPGAAAHGDLKPPRRMKRSRSLRRPDGRVHFAGDYMTDMSSWMQGAFDSAREVAMAIHQRALARS